MGLMMETEGVLTEVKDIEGYRRFARRETSNQSELLDPGLADWLDPLATARAFYWCLGTTALERH
jgi:hypothetical protein